MLKLAWKEIEKTLEKVKTIRDAFEMLNKAMRCKIWFKM